MLCPLCENKGVIRIGYREEPLGWVDYAICRCAKGLRFRTPGHIAALAAKYDTDEEHIGLVEELLDPEDFPVSMREPVAAVAVVDVTDAGRRGGPKKARL